MLENFYRNKALGTLKSVKMFDAEAHANELFTCFIRRGAKPLILLGLLFLGSPAKIIKTLGLPNS